MIAKILNQRKDIKILNGLLDEMITELMSYENLNSVNIDRKTGFNYTLPVIETTKEEYVYNFSYEPLPNFLKVIKGKLDTSQNGLYNSCSDVLTDIIRFKYIIYDEKLSFFTDPLFNTMQIYNNGDENILKTIEDKKVDLLLKNGLNTIRLNEKINGSIKLVFDKPELKIPYIKLYDTSYTNDIEIKLDFNNYRYVQFDYGENSKVVINNIEIPNNQFAKLIGETTVNITNPKGKQELKKIRIKKVV